ncbi:MAG: hypothetical protein K2I93_05115, partial [Oscillospiraceae bacterium]|nr:hypothetical protein [Oscillospiraceae bacterium]
MFHISTIIIPLLITLSGIGLSFKLLNKKTKMYRFAKPILAIQSDMQYCLLLSGILFLCQLCLFLLTDCFIAKYTAAAQDGLPVSVKLTISLLMTGWLVTKLWLKHVHIKRLVLCCSILSVVLMLSELLLFNAKSITGNYHEQSLQMEQIQTTTPDLIEQHEDNILLKNGAVLTIETPPDFTRVISLDLEQREENVNFRVQLGMKDNNLAMEFQTVGDKYVGGHGYNCDFTVVPYGNIRSLSLTFIELPGNVTLHGATMMSHVPFCFSSLRYFVLLFLGGLTALIIITRFDRVVYDAKRKSHRIAALAMTVLCTASAVLFYLPDQELIPYPLESDNAYGFDPYVQVFDAFENDRVWIDIPVDENLNTLENVYDAIERRSSGFRYAWDRALFEGKYYSYFGVAPVFILYYPVYWITGKLPTLPIANDLFSTLLILFQCLAILEAVRMFVKKPNFLLLLLSLAASAGLGGAYYCLQCPNMYCVVLSAGLCFLFLTIYLGLRAVRAQKKAARLLLLLGSGIALGLCAASRPITAVGALILTPVFLAILLEKKVPLKFRLTQAGTFLLPVILTGVGLMHYNTLRFGNPFDFGAAYQLTVSDVHANKLRLSALFPAIYHYFLQSFGTSPTFPFVRVQYFSMTNYGMYVYNSRMLGALQYPLLMLGTVMLPGAFPKTGERVVRLRRQWTLLLCFILSVGIA